MKEKSYKIFNDAIIFLRSNDYNKVVQVLSEINYHELTLASRNLYDAILKRIPGNHALSQAPYRPDGYLAEYDLRQPITGVSLVSCCMNRNANLKKSLNTWLQLPVDEIVIVDWSSSTPVSETISDINDDRIKIVRVEGESRWVLTYAFNVGLRFSSFSKVFKLDADIQVNSNFLEKNNFDSNSYIRGSWKSALESGAEDQVFVNGSFGCEKKSLLHIGFYNELIRTYGWDDSDLYERLSHECGLSQKFLSFDSLHHLNQENDERTKYQDVFKHQFLNKVPTTEFNNQRNRFIARNTDYWNTSRLQNYSIKKGESNQWTCTRVTPDASIPDHLIEDANAYAAMHYIWHHASYIFQDKSDIKQISHAVYFMHANKIPMVEDIFKQKATKISFYLGAAAQLKSFLFELCERQASQLDSYVLFVLAESDFVLIKNNIYVVGFRYPIFSALKRRLDSNSKLSINCEAIVKSDVVSLFEVEKRKVYVDAQHGLGNRLRAIGSAAAIAEKSNRELIIVWEPDHHCECDFHDLFEYTGTVLRKSLLQAANETMTVYNYMEIEPGACKDAEIIIDPERDLYLRAAYTFKSPLSDWNTENAFLRSLKPSKAILDLTNGFNLENTIAAHIRMEAGAGLDHNTYDSVKNWTQEGHDLLHYWRDKSHFSHFIKRIDQILSENPNQKLFLATDLPETYKTFEQYYGNKLTYLKRNAYDRSKEQIIYALADAILLSRCQKLLGSTWSSFSELAMRLSTTYSEIEMSGKDF